MAATCMQWSLLVLLTFGLPCGTCDGNSDPIADKLRAQAPDFIPALEQQSQSWYEACFHDRTVCGDPVATVRLLANLSAWVYGVTEVDSPAVTDTSLPGWCRSCKLLLQKRSGTTGLSPAFVALDVNGTWVLVFRGTSNVNEALADAAAFPIPFDRDDLSGAYVHGGFHSMSVYVMQRYGAKFAQHLRALRPSRIVLTGHSLGGAVAQALMFDYMAQQRGDARDRLGARGGLFQSPARVHAVTFGAPLVFANPRYWESTVNTTATYKSFADNCVNYVNNDDIVPRAISLINWNFAVSALHTFFRQASHAFLMSWPFLCTALGVLLGTGAFVKLLCGAVPWGRLLGVWLVCYSGCIIVGDALIWLLPRLAGVLLLFEKPSFTTLRALQHYTHDCQVVLMNSCRDDFVPFLAKGHAASAALGHVSQCGIDPVADHAIQRYIDTLATGDAGARPISDRRMVMCFYGAFLFGWILVFCHRNRNRI